MVGSCLITGCPRGAGGVQEQLSTFFKAPMVKNGHGPEHAFGKQERMLHDWLGVN